MGYLTILKLGSECSGTDEKTITSETLAPTEGWNWYDVKGECLLKSFSRLN
jgi:hypothetical protein